MIIAVNKIRASNGEQILENAIVNVLDGLEPRTVGSVMLTEEKDGTYTINDGFHRIAEAILDGNESIVASIRVSRR